MTVRAKFIRLHKTIRYILLNVRNSHTSFVAVTRHMVVIQHTKLQSRRFSTKWQVTFRCFSVPHVHIIHLPFSGRNSHDLTENVRVAQIQYVQQSVTQLFTTLAYGTPDGPLWAWGLGSRRSFSVLRHKHLCHNQWPFIYLLQWKITSLHVIVTCKSQTKSLGVNLEWTGTKTVQSPLEFAPHVDRFWTNLHHKHISIYAGWKVWTATRKYLYGTRTISTGLALVQF